MKRKYFLLLIVFTVLTVTGIILIQGYWIHISLKTKEEEFSSSVNKTLQFVSDKIHQNEVQYYIDTFESIIDSTQATPASSKFQNIFVFYDKGNATKLSSLYTYGVLEEEYNIPKEAIRGDSIPLGYEKLTGFKGVKTTTIQKEAFDRENSLSFSLQKSKETNRINAINNATYQSLFSEMANSFPIQKRLNKKELEVILEQELKKNNILTPFGFKVYKNEMETEIISANYPKNIEEFSNYKTPIFINDKGDTPYSLVLVFPEKKRYLRSSVIRVATLSFFLILLIIIICGSAIYQILKQKKLSQIKSDFINNMSHEFKTPIATINLALDAMKSPANIGDPSKIERYLKIVKEENKRMHTHIENVLLISQLEDSDETILKKAKEEFHTLIDESINHVKLLMNSRGGEFLIDYKATKSTLSVDRSHIINVLVNVLDNAIKYSEETPIVSIKTLSNSKYFEVKIEDKGIGMNIETQKFIFERFYRAQRGDIHNVKGHGLGLSYVKKIVFLHDGKVDVKSKKNEGTVFSIKFPLDNNRL